jgi:cobalt-zinc-cadmium efflux system membrane fusion protein
MHVKNIVAIGALTIVGVGLLGCGKATDSATPAAPATSVSDGAHSHDGWWCNEHGVPEEVCTQCNAKLVADFRANGDWCKEHDVPESQCFVCHPEKEAEFAAQYEAKYGKKPPKVEGSAGEHHDHDHDAKS